MSSILLVQAVIVATSGRMYKTQPREFREGGADLDEWKSGLRSDMRMGTFPIDFINDHGHSQVIMPTLVETIIFSVLGSRPEHVHTEPNYEALKAGWNQTLHPERDAEQTQVIPVVPVPPVPSTELAIPQPPADATVPPRPKPAPPKAGPPAPAASRARRVGTGKVEATVNPDGSKSWKFAEPGPVPGVFDIRSERTEEMPIPGDPRTMAQRTVERVAGLTGRSEQGRSGAPRGRRSQRGAGPGKVTQD